MIEPSVHNPDSISPDSVAGPTSGAVSGPVEQTLRLIAQLPAPAGLEDRVHSALRAAPRKGRILAWPARFSDGAGWARGSALRGAAAAAIVFVVAGGGWGVYSRVQPSRVIAMPPRLSAPGGFSNAGAMRTPQTLNRPVVSPAAAPLHPKGASRPEPVATAHGQTGAKAAPAAIPAR